MKVFAKGEYVVCGNKGVCCVEDITTLNISGIDRDRKYYILKPVYLTGSTVYVAAGTAEESLRRVLSHQQADELLEMIPDIQPLTITNDKLLEQTYKECIRSNNCREWVRIMKTIYDRKKRRLEAGRKVTALDAKYFRMAEDYLYGELSVALSISRADVENTVADRMNRIE